MRNQFLRPEVLFVFTVCCLLSVTVKGNGQTVAVQEALTMKAATDLVRSHDMFKDPMVMVLRTGEIPAEIREIEHYQPQYVAFKTMGWIELTAIKKADAQAPDSATKTLITLTEKGRDESKNWKQTRENEWQMPMAVKEVVEVIKIHYAGEIPAGIEFSWTYTPNKLGEALKFTYRKEKAYATIQRLDGSWKIIKIRAIS
jgi:hypothetical protein